MTAKLADDHVDLRFLTDLPSTKDDRTWLDHGDVRRRRGDLQ